MHYDRQHILVNRDRLSASQMTTLVFAPVFIYSLSAVRFVHVVKLYVFTSLVVMLWCQLRFPRKNDVRLVSTPISFVGVYFIFILFALYYVYWCPTQFHVVLVTVLLSPSFHWRWFVSFQTWTSCIQRGRNSLYL